MRKIVFKWKKEKGMNFLNLDGKFVPIHNLEVWTFSKNHNDRGHLIGYISACQDSNGFFLFSCRVHGLYQRMGIGTFMLRLVQARFRTFPLHLKCCWSKVSFYQKVGFDVAGWEEDCKRPNGVVSMVYYRGGKNGTMQ